MRPPTHDRSAAAGVAALSPGGSGPTAPPRPRLRLTASGWIGLGAGVLLLAAAALWRQAVPGLCGAFLLALLTGAAVLARRNLAGLRYRRRLPDLVMAGEALRLEMLPSSADGQIACFVDVHDEAAGNGCYFEPRPLLAAGTRAEPWHLPALLPGRPEQARWPVQLLRRGEFADFRYRFSSCHPFGLWLATVDGVSRSPVTVYPAAAPAYDLIAEAAADGLAPAQSAPQRHAGIGEFRGLREFQNGDMLKQVAWRATARFGVPVVKEFDPELPGRFLVALHTWTPNGSHLAIDAFEHGLEQVTGFVLELAQQGRPFAVLAPWTDWQAAAVDPDGEGLDAVLAALALAPLRRQTHRRRLHAALLEQMAPDTVGWVVGPGPVDAWEQDLPAVPGRLFCVAYGARHAQEETEA